MAGLNLKQIEDKLNEQFQSDERTLIFWYDDAAEFEQDIEHLELDNAKIHQLTENNLFQTKVMLERQDRENNYLLFLASPLFETSYFQLIDESSHCLILNAQYLAQTQPQHRTKR